MGKTTNNIHKHRVHTHSHLAHAEISNYSYNKLKRTISMMKVKVNKLKCALIHAGTHKNTSVLPVE